MVKKDLKKIRVLSSFNLLYSYSVKDEEYFQTLKHGEVGPYQKVLIRQVKMQFFKDYHYHKMECILFKNTFLKHRHQLQK